MILIELNINIYNIYWLFNIIKKKYINKNFVIIYNIIFQIKTFKKFSNSIIKNQKILQSNEIIINFGNFCYNIHCELFSVRIFARTKVTTWKLYDLIWWN